MNTTCNKKLTKNTRHCRPHQNDIQTLKMIKGLGKCFYLIDWMNDNKAGTSQIWEMVEFHHQVPPQRRPSFDFYKFMIPGGEHP